MSFTGIPSHPRLHSTPLYCDHLYNREAAKTEDFFTLHDGGHGLHWKVAGETMIPECSCPDDREQKKESMNAFIQYWLFFGVLRQIFTGIDRFNVYTFINILSNGKHVITTQPLDNLIARWTSLVENDRDRCYIRLINVRKVLNHARTFAMKYLSVQELGPGDNFEVTWPVDDTLAYSILVLGQILTHALHRLELKLSMDVFPYQLDQLDEYWGPSRLILDLLRNTSWSLDNIKTLMRFWVNDTVGLQLSLCFGQADMYSREAPEKFKAYHFDRCPSTCDLLGANIQNRVLEIHKKGNIPLFRFTEKDELEVESMTAPYDKEYLIFSHIWMDGFSNPDVNCLHRCVLQRFREIFKEIRNLEIKAQRRYPYDNTPGYFWIDSLGIPVAPGQEYLRRVAVQQIHDIYRHAKYTIILDKGLLREQYSDVLNNFSQLGTTISLSSWMRRLWTLQEAVLSKNLFFNFADGLISLDMLENLFRTQRQNIYDCVASSARRYHELMLEGERLRRILHTNDPSAVCPRLTHSPQFLGQVWRTAQWRDPSRPHHEALALATIFGLNTSELARVYDHQQQPTQRYCDEAMQTFMRLLGQENPTPLHAGMIFLPGPHLPDAGYGWAPRSWTTKHHIEYPDPLSLPCGEVRLLVPYGLEVQFPGYILHGLKQHWLSIDDDKPFHFSAQVETQEWYCVSRADKTPWPEQKDFADSSLAIIKPQMSISVREQIALLVKIVGRRAEVFTAGILTRIWIRRVLDSNQIKMYAREEAGTGVICAGQPLPEKQKWCVDRADTPAVGTISSSLVVRPQTQVPTLSIPVPRQPMSQP